MVLSTWTRSDPQSSQETDNKEYFANYMTEVCLFWCLGPALLLVKQLICTENSFTLYKYMLSREEKSIIKKATKFKRLNTKYTHHTLIYQGYKTILPIKIWVFCRYKVCICFPLYSDKTSNIEDQKKGDNCEAPITTIIGNFNNENNYWEF